MGTIITTALLIPLAQELGNQLANAFTGIGVTSVPLPSESPAITLDPSISLEENLTDTLSVPQADVKVDSKPKNRAMPGYYYLATLTRPGITVDLTMPLTYQEAMAHVLIGHNVWTPCQSSASTLAFFAAGAVMQITNDPYAICIPYNASNEGRCRSGQNAYHYHILNGKMRAVTFIIKMFMCFLHIKQ